MLQLFHCYPIYLDATMATMTEMAKGSHRDAYRQAIQAVLTHLRLRESSVVLSSFRRFLARPFPDDLCDVDAVLLCMGDVVVS